MDRLPPMKPFPSSTSFPSLRHFSSPPSPPPLSTAFPAAWRTRPVIILNEKDDANLLESIAAADFFTNDTAELRMGDELEIDQLESESSGGRDSSLSSPRRRERSVTSPEQKRALNALWNTTRFPSMDVRSDLANDIGMSPKRVQIWFQNRRQLVRRAEEQSIRHRSSTTSTSPQPDRRQSLPSLSPEIYMSSSSSSPSPHLLSSSLFAFNAPPPSASHSRPQPPPRHHSFPSHSNLNYDRRATLPSIFKRVIPLDDRLSLRSHSTTSSSTASSSSASERQSVTLPSLWEMVDRGAWPVMGSGTSLRDEAIPISPEGGWRKTFSFEAGR